MVRRLIVCQNVVGMGAERLLRGDETREASEYSGRLRAGFWWPALAVLCHALLLLQIGNLYGSVDDLFGLHDGIYYTAHLADPFLQGDLSWWDNIPYRGLRVGYVLLALPVRFLGVVPALVLVNLVAVAVGTIAVRRISRIHGANAAIAGVLWFLNPGALMSTALLLPDTVAWTLVLLCVLGLFEGRYVRATALGVLAVLVKEAALAALVVACIVRFLKARDWRGLVPVSAALAIHQTLFGLLTMHFGPSFHGAFLGWPVSGWLDVWAFWSGAEFLPISQIIGIVVFLSGIAVLVAWARDPSNLFLAAAGAQAILMLILDMVVLFTWSNTTRIAQPFWPVLAATRRGSRTRTAPPESEIRVDLEDFAK